MSARKRWKTETLERELPQEVGRKDLAIAAMVVGEGSGMENFGYPISTHGRCVSTMQSNIALDRFALFDCNGSGTRRAPSLRLISHDKVPELVLIGQCRYIDLVGGGKDTLLRLQMSPAHI